MIRRLLRVCAEQLLPAGAAGRQIGIEHREDLLVLAFHNVVPDAVPLVGDRSLHLRLSTFCALVDRLLESVAPAQLGDDPDEEHRPRLVITFDDAYRGAMTLALPELAKRAVPSMTFVPTDMVGNRSFWWDALAGSGGGLDPEVRGHALESLGGDDARIRDWAAGQGLPLAALPAEWHTVTLEELRHAAELPGVMLAPHSASHRALDRISPPDLDAEMHAPLEWFERSGLPYRRFLAYPYGRWSPLVCDAAAAAGYESAWRISGGWHRSPGPERFTLPRLNIPAGATVRRLMWRIAQPGADA